MVTKLWNKIPETYREILKEVWRWVVATLYSILVQVIQELVLTGQFDFTLETGKLLMGMVVVRFLDRLSYLVKVNATNKTVKEVAGTASKLYSLST